MQKLNLDMALALLLWGPVGPARVLLEQRGFYGQPVFMGEQRKVTSVNSKPPRLRV
jgi:hypothetical protein